ncbi:ABC transporter permease [Pedobacter endophyticus]|uniref:ABC transporter permease n=1 Tax=Pedobacter endophyticus TaxID=2789740 RepID=A0A7S9PZ99_9SPHI|nr:ABC transporter permease [Pedobacter endophyticus]QPH39501.1 ABC transporter permease [Pedobacter endophyticus]
MFKLNLKIALRSLWNNKGYAFISIVGLAVALTIFILTMLYANYEKSYDAWNPGFEHIYRVNYKSATEDVALSPGNMATTSKEKIPAVEASTRIQDYWFGDLLVKTKAKSVYVNDVVLADSNFLKVFDYPLVYGDGKTALSKPQTLILSKTMSETIFGKGVNPVGEAVVLDNNLSYTVTAVIDEARFPAHFHFNLIRRFKKSVNGEYYSNNFYTYLKLNPQSSIVQTEAMLNKNRTELLNIELAKIPNEEKADFAEYIKENTLYLQPIKNIHLSKLNVEYEFQGNGMGKYMYLMFLVAGLVLIIAAVNFTNLSITIATKRAKETGVRKVLGAQRFQIGTQFILETGVQCLLSLMFAIIMVELFLPAFNNTVGSAIQLENLSDYRLIFGQILILLLAITLVVGLYPALLISRVIPAKVLKGNFANSNSGYWIRNGLIVLQFVIAVLFISGIWIINSQLRYMQQKDLGYKPQQVVAIAMQEYGEKHFRAIKNTLKNIEGVLSISRADHIPGEDMGGNSYGNEGKSYSSNFITVDVDYFETMGMKLLDGRGYSASNPADTLNSLVLTETAAKTFNLKNPVGKIVQFRQSNARVIGLVKDFNHYSPEKSYQPIVFQYMKGNPLRYVLLNISSTNAPQIIAEIESAWTKLEPNFPIKYTLLDRSFEKMLAKQTQLRSIIGFLSLLTIGLALMGIFAIAAFNTQRRFKEINIRKVLGASLFDILGLLNKGFAKLVILANIIAWPMAYLILREWLNGFAFRIDMPVLPFALAGLITLFLTALIVSLQSLKAAKANPVDALKYE